jgi:hypothetical protein
MSTQTTTDLAARFEAKREEAWNKYIRTGYVGRSDVAAFNAGWDAARDMARADAAGGAGWQPIATAPKDGEAILLWSGIVMRVGWWFEDDEVWRLGNDSILRAPTHWMPLPAKPGALGLAAAPPPPAQQGSSSPLRQGETVGELERLIRHHITIYYHNAVDYDLDPDSVRECAEAIASLATARDGGTGAGWQPIATAPKGEMLWLFEPHAMGGFQFCGCRTSDDTMWVNNLDGIEQHPTHWMPMPASPAVTNDLIQSAGEACHG